MQQRGRAADADGQMEVVTQDGWRLRLQVFSPRGAERRHTVVCCHGMAANHLAFHPAGHLSLARYLSRRGYRVVLLDLRGHGASERASYRGPRRYSFGFDDYLQQDVPAAISAAGAGERVHWIGHSMGGVLLLAYLASGGDQVASAVTLGSSLDYSGSASGFRALLPLRAALKWLPALPVDTVAALSGRLTGRITTRYEQFNVWSSNTDMALWRHITQRGFHPVSSQVMAQLASALEPGGVRAADGGRHLERLPRARTPVLCVTGDKDAQCPPEAARRTAEALHGAGGELLILGPQAGHADHYGHFDMLIGKRAASEVFPRIAAWLDRHDQPAVRAAHASGPAPG